MVALMHQNLGAFVQALESADELVRIAEPVSPVLHIAEIADRVSKSPCAHLPSQSARRNDPRFCALGGRALLFENVIGSRVPLLINAWGSYRRMEMALGVQEAGPGSTAGPRTRVDASGARLGGFDALGQQIGELVKPQPPRSFAELVAKARQILPLLKIPPKRTSSRGACQEVVLTGDDIDLTTLPLLRCWPHDGDFAALGYPEGVNANIAGLGTGPDWERDNRGRYITLAGIHTIHASDVGQAKPSSHNIGMYRVQLLGKRTLAMHWHMHHDGARHWRSWKKLGQPMPVAIALGGPSVMPYAATAPLPPGISELLLAGFLAGRALRLCPGITVPVGVPAESEIIIEGFVSTEAGFIDYDPRGDEPIGPGGVFEGPFGDHTGFYSLPDRYPLLTVTAVTMRRKAIYPTTIVGLPPQEDYYIGKATERLFLPLLKTIVHDIEDYDLPMFGAFHNAAVLQIKKEYPLQGRRVMHSIWGAGQMAWTKSLFIVPAETDPHDLFAVMQRCAKFCHPIRDVELAHGPLDILDHAAPFLGAGTKIGFDATTKQAAESVHGVPAVGELIAARLTASAKWVAIAQGISGVREAAAPAELGCGWLLLRVEKQTAGQGRAVLTELARLFASDEFAAEPTPPFVLAVSGIGLGDIDKVLFHWCAHSDAGRDAVRYRSADHRRCALMFDATTKMAGDERHGMPVRRWPPVLSMDADTQAAVTREWPTYGIPATGS